MIHTPCPAHAGLREATLALEAATLANSTDGEIVEGDHPELARDLAETLDAVVTLLGTLGVHPGSRFSPEGSLQGITRQVFDAADLADRVARRGGLP